MLKKSKLFVIAIAFVAVFAVASVASAADLGSSTLRKGSSGPYVVTLQTILGVSADGAFGPMTEAAVKAWQASHGLVADGIVGPATKAAMNSASGVTPPPASGCQAGWVVNPMTGASCVTAQLPAGCTSTVGFSPTTGAKCDGAVVPDGTNNGPLVGAEGDITLDDFTSGTERTLGEGKSEKVLGVKVSADDGSDVAINTMKIVIDQPNVDAGESTRLERYIEGVNIYMDSTKAGSVDVSDFSKSGTVYTKSVSLSNAVVRRDANAKFYVEVEAKSDISSELLDNTWKLALTSVRFTDAMGVVNTIPVATGDVAVITFEFESATENDKISTTSSSNNPEATTLKVSDTGTSDEYLVFAFKLKADKDSSDLNVLEIPITVTTDSADVEDVVSDIYLKVGSKVYDDFDVENGDTDEAVYTFTIDEGDLTLDSGETVEVKVYAEFMKEGLLTTYYSSEEVTFSLVGSNLVVENTDGDSVNTSGVADRNGNLMTLSTSSTIVSNVTTSSTIDSDGKVATYTFKFTVEADGDDVILSNATIEETVSQGVVPSFSIKKDSGNATGNLGVTYTVADGDTASFTVTYTVDPTGPATTGTYYVTIDTIAGVSVDKTAGPETITTL